MKSRSPIISKHAIQPSIPASLQLNLSDLLRTIFAQANFRELSFTQQNKLRATDHLKKILKHFVEEKQDEEEVAAASATPTVSSGGVAMPIFSRQNLGAPYFHIGKPQHADNVPFIQIA